MNDKELYKLACKVADMAFEYISDDPKNRRSLYDRRTEEPNPYYNQTESGLFIESNYGFPGYLWTPWGKWSCWGGGIGHWVKAMSQFLNRLGAVEYQPLRRTQMGDFGPVYAITSVDGKALPPAVERKRDQYLEYEEADAAWKSLKK